MPSLARGRKLQEAACLRITRIEKVLATRTDLSMAERRSLRARKNTANFRERRKIAQELKHFHTVELDAILNYVSEVLHFYNFGYKETYCIFATEDDSVRHMRNFKCLTFLIFLKLIGQGACHYQSRTLPKPAQLM